MLLHFIFLVKEEELEKRKWEFNYVTNMAQFYKTWIEKTFSREVVVQADEMVQRSGNRFNLVDVPTILEDHKSRGENIFHFYLTYFRPLWTDCTCEGYFAENFGMIWWEKSKQEDDINFLMERNCSKVSHELAHEFLRQLGYKSYKEIVHEIWDKHIFASLPFEHYDSHHKKSERDPLFATIDTSSLQL
ncbi:MAG: hypothetical protein AUI60_02460 [Thaumarchaeota archaeon 13_1_40CM_2_39_4]|nr:MAG: hypothetical protein AUI60_02460 [Thaumarchaeota archaeon 13_1_40CM_2_39_4]